MISLAEQCNRVIRTNWFAPILLLLLGILICTSAYFNQTWEGGADNYWHFYFSKYAFQFPQFFLHHWGKPIFILLTSPIAQLGFYAVTIFNVCCGLLSAYIVYRWSQILKYTVPHWAILLVIMAPMYLATMQSSLTEPLFSLLVLLSAFLIFKENFFIGALLSSTLMYSRSEGLFILLIFIAYYVLRKKFKYLPLFAFSFLIYSLAGLFSGHDFLWYFTENPYRVQSPYGHGTWYHFFTRYDFTFGGPFLLMMLIGLFLIIRKVKWNRNEFFESKEVKLLFLAFIPSLCFFLFHVYAWYTGKFASAGVDRVMASVIPLSAVIAMSGMDLIGRVRFFLLRNAILLLFFGFLWNAAFKQFSYPLKASDSNIAEKEAVNWFMSVRKPNSTIFYANPEFVFYANYDPFDKSNRECFAFPSNSCIPLDIKGKYYYIWDSDFSEFSCGKKLSDLENCAELIKMKEFRGGDKFHLVIFESKDSIE